MKTRPWPIVLLALFHLLAPLPNAVLSAAFQRTGLVDYLRGFSPFDAFAAVVVFPAAAYSIYSMKRWSYAAYLGCMGVIAYFNFVSWRQFPELFSLPACIAVIGLDLAVTSYFLLPAVRATYFDSRLRWWESKPRYQIGLEARAGLVGLGPESEVTLVNLSEGGAFVRGAVPVRRGERLAVRFSILGREFSVLGLVVHATRLPGERPYAHGLEFELARDSKRELTDLIRAFELIGLRDTRSARLTLKDFADWAGGLSSGKGWVPEVPSSRKPTSAPGGEYAPWVSPAALLQHLPAASSQLPALRAVASVPAVRAHKASVRASETATSPRRGRVASEPALWAAARVVATRSASSRARSSHPRLELISGAESAAAGRESMTAGQARSQGSRLRLVPAGEGGQTTRAKSKRRVTATKVRKPRKAAAVASRAKRAA
jgi:hypothetical protein